MLSIQKYSLLNKKNEDKLNNSSKKNLKSLDYETNRDEKIYKFMKFNSYSIKNILNPRNSDINDKSDLPFKMKLNQKRNITYENQLIIPDNIFQNSKHLEKKATGKSILNETKYKNNSISLEPFSPRRILTIPTYNNHYGYDIDEKGKIELLEDPDILDKFNGTKNNSIGPDRYNIIFSPRKRFIIDWSKNVDNKNILNKNSTNDLNNIKVLSKLDNLFLTNIKRRNYVHKGSKNKIELSKNNNYRIKEWKKEEEYIRDKLLKYEKQKMEEQAFVGPGSYDLSDEFIVSPKKNKFQNFGSYKSRNMNSQKKIKNDSIENNIKYYFLTENNRENKNENNDKLTLFKNSKFYSYKLKAKLLKEKSILDKQLINEKLGPGIYEPKEKKIIKENNVGNFGFEKRNLFNDDKKEKPINSFYLPQEDWTKKFKNVPKPEQKKDNILKFFEDLEPKAKKTIEENYEQRKENEKEKEKEINININYNLYRPGFGSDEPRFYIFKSDVNIFNGVGSYELNPPRKNKEQFKPFIYSSRRHNLVKNDNNPKLGPGTYNKYDTFFQWNKKTYNVKIKDRINEFKHNKS